MIAEVVPSDYSDSESEEESEQTDSHVITCHVVINFFCVCLLVFV